MNRKELEARVAELESVLKMTTGIVVTQKEHLDVIRSRLAKARAELAAMRVEARLAYVWFDSEGQTRAVHVAPSDYLTFKLGSNPVAMIELLPADEEVLEALKQSDFGCHGYCNVKALARELRARLPKDRPSVLVHAPVATPKDSP